MHYFIVSWRGWHTSLGHTLLGWLDIIMMWLWCNILLLRSNHPWHILLGHTSLESILLFVGG
jgi:hypothetical protein